MKPLVSIIIPTKNRGTIFDLTLLNVQSAVQNIQAEIIIINDSKTNEIKIPQNSKNIILLTNTKNGVASARNLGASVAKSELLLFLDDDIIINEDNLTSLIKLHNYDSTNCYLPNWEYPKNLIDRIKNIPFGRYLISNRLTSLHGWSTAKNWSNDSAFQINNGASYCLPISKKVFESIKGYNESFPHAGAEDYDFCYRLNKSGVKFFIYPMTTVYHNEEDRIEMKNWLERKKRDSETKIIAVKLGYSELQINYKRSKILLFKLVKPLKNLFFIILNVIPNSFYTDKLYSKIVNILCAIYIYEGFTKKDTV